MEKNLPGYNRGLTSQIVLLHNILQKNDLLFEIIEQAQKLELDNYYIGAGCIAQTVWNFQNRNNLMFGISDIDLVYFDAKNLSSEAEDRIIRHAKTVFKNTAVQVDIKNQARVHLWYEKNYGYAVEPYPSVESAINTWPATATAVGVRLENRDLTVYAPYGLNDLFGQIVRANKTRITQKIYEEKADQWIRKWPGIIRHTMVIDHNAEADFYIHSVFYHPATVNQSKKSFARHA